MGAQLAYHYSGSLGSDNFYIERSADQELYNHLRARQTCFVFNCRQMGKSSLRVRTMQRLQAEGVVCVEINPQQRGASLSEDQWYAGTIHQLIKDVGLKEEVSFSRWWEEPVVQALGPVERLWHFNRNSPFCPRNSSPPRLSSSTIALRGTSRSFGILR